MTYSIPKGLFDILPEDPDPKNSWRNVDRWQYVEGIMKEVMRNYSFREIRTPIFERKELFVRSVGDVSDIVSKEMYNFMDKGEREMTLRPEGTAPVMRSFFEKHLETLGSVHKFYYIGPFFRYDRPQAGRFRQFHQLGVEYIGSESPYCDAEIIEMLHQIYVRLGIRNLRVRINSIGDQSTRKSYGEALRNYLEPYKNDLSNDSLVRLDKNPLRILDTKNTLEQQILINSPAITDYLTPDSRAHFEEVTDVLERLGISYELDPRLVRGLDYYNQTVFEISSDALGAQNTIGAGGRFDGLLAFLGGPDLPACGFATGIERILITMSEQNCYFPSKPAPFFFFLPLDEESKRLLLPILYALRHQNIPIEIDSKIRKIHKSLQYANRLQVKFCLIVGEEEIQSGQFRIKDMNSGKTEHIHRENVADFIKKLWSEHV